MEFPAQIYQGPELVEDDFFEQLPEEYQALLKKTSGLIAFNGGLHLRGCCVKPLWHSLKFICQGSFALYKVFKSVEKEDIPFGQDAYGNQFIFREKLICRVNTETDNCEELNINFTEFLLNVEMQGTEFLNLNLLGRFIEHEGFWTPGNLLSLYPPITRNKTDSEIQMKSIPMFERYRFLSQLALKRNKA